MHIKILTGAPEGEIPLMRIRFPWDANIKIYHNEIGYWIQCWTSMNSVIMS